MQIKRLSIRDLATYKLMQTGIEGDYIIDVFERLVTPPDHALFGLYQQNQLVSVAGYSIFPGGYAMLGRLRSDIRYQGKGHATQLLLAIIAELEINPNIRWVGGYTNIHNDSARRVLDKLGFQEIKTFYNLPMKDRSLIQSAQGKVWDQVHSLEEKRSILATLAETVLDVYPYECYYPFPYRTDLLTDQKLAETYFYHNYSKDRWLLISNDFKQEAYAHVRYFWDDYFEQAGLFETIDAYLSRQSEERKPYFDFSPKAYQRIPNLAAFEVSDGWVLYGRKIR
ncbi:GNAT family N-acetyltransferase [Amphibacillus sediminis]|uniref:GNAT family N-acetyltransferase n=1 Tax=Amphibacillus sediminis TaxID=360185 RepID=UPI00083200B8|nr:GNAT family N-acetyltransferase [Amphibacillus sediminis]